MLFKFAAKVLFFFDMCKDLCEKVRFVTKKSAEALFFTARG